MAKHLRPTRLDEKKRDKLLKEVEKDRQRLNDAVAALAAPAIGITVNDVNVLQKVSKDWLKQYLTDNYKRFVATSGFVPAATRQRVLDEYNQAGAAAEPYVITIEAIMKQRNAFPVKIDSKGKFWFDEKTVKAWATEQATRHFTEDEQRYYTLLGEVVEVLNKVAEFERAKRMKPFAIHGQSYWYQDGTNQDGTPHHGTTRHLLRDYLCKRNEQGQIVGDMELTVERYVNLIDHEGLFPAK